MQTDRIPSQLISQNMLNDAVTSITQYLPRRVDPSSRRLQAQDAIYGQRPTSDVVDARYLNRFNHSRVARSVQGGYPLDQNGQVIRDVEGPATEVVKRLSNKPLGNTTYYADSLPHAEMYTGHGNRSVDSTIYVFNPKDIKSLPSEQSNVLDEVLRGGLPGEIQAAAPVSARPTHIFKPTPDQNVGFNPLRRYVPSNVSADHVANTVLKNFGLPPLAKQQPLTVGAGATLEPMKQFAVKQRIPFADAKKIMESPTRLKLFDQVVNSAEFQRIQHMDYDMQRQELIGYLTGKLGPHMYRLQKQLRQTLEETRRPMPFALLPNRYAKITYATLNKY